MENFDYDLRSIQEARDLARRGEAAAKKMAGYTSGQIDMILQNMVRTAEAHGACLARMAVEETGFGKVHLTRPTRTTPRPRFFTTISKI